MKKPALYGAFLALFTILFAQCDFKEYYTVTITNDTGKKVSYTYNGASYELSAAESATYEVTAYTRAPQNIVDHKTGIACVRSQLDNMTGNYTFIDADYYLLKVTNKSPFEVTFRAGNFIDNGEGSPSLTVEAADPDAEETDDGEEEDSPYSGPVIYTKNPQFKSNHPVVFDWEIVEKDMNVIIK